MTGRYTNTPKVPPEKISNRFFAFFGAEFNNLTNRYFPIVFALFAIFGCPLLLRAQSPGIVVRPASGSTSTVLDPDQNRFTSLSSSGFAGADVGAAYSEIPYHVVPPFIIGTKK